MLIKFNAPFRPALGSRAPAGPPEAPGATWRSIVSGYLLCFA